MPRNGNELSVFLANNGGEGGINQAAPSPFGPPPILGDVLRHGFAAPCQTLNQFNNFNLLERHHVQIVSSAGQKCPQIHRLSGPCYYLHKSTKT